MKLRRGFTLIELLVVVAIIATIASLLMPGIAMAISMARNAKCLSNLRQIGMAMNGYADDNDDLLPPVLYNWPSMLRGLYWYESIVDYALQRKANRDQMNKSNMTAVGANVLQGCDSRDKTASSYKIGYGMNSKLGLPASNKENYLRPYTVNQNNYSDWSLSRVDYSSSRILVGDSDDPFLRASGSTWTLPFADPVRHRKVANFLFCDGHVAPVDATRSALGVAFPEKLNF